MIIALSIILVGVAGLYLYRVLGGTADRAHVRAIPVIIVLGVAIMLLRSRRSADNG